MYYYIMQQDNSSKEIPVIKDWYGKIDTLQMNPGGYQNLPDVSAFFADFAPNCHFKEIISVPFLLFPKEAGHIIKIFEPWLRYKDIVLISKTTDSYLICNRGGIIKIVTDANGTTSDGTDYWDES